MLQVSAALVSSEASLLALQRTTFLLSPHTAFLCADTSPGISLYFQIFTSYKDISNIGLEPTLTIPFKFKWYITF